MMKALQSVISGVREFAPINLILPFRELPQLWRIQPRSVASHFGILRMIVACHYIASSKVGAKHCNEHWASVGTVCSHDL